MNKKFILTSILAITFAMPAMAEITSGATCDTANLGQSENNSTANVEADWTANTININWYIDGDAQTTLATNTCTYDGTITLPAEPAKTGYTFAGWRLRGSILQQAGESMLAGGCGQKETEESCNANATCAWINNSCYRAHDWCTSATTAEDCAQHSSTLQRINSWESCSWSNNGCDAILNLLG